MVPLGSVDKFRHSVESGGTCSGQRRPGGLLKLKVIETAEIEELNGNGCWVSKEAAKEQKKGK